MKNSTKSIYHPGNRDLQDRYDSRRLADRLQDVTVHSRFTRDDKEFIEQMEMFFLATADPSGQPTCSYKGGAPGFVKVIDESTLVFPNYDGNGMFLSTGNVLVNAKVGLLFIDFENQMRMRVQGTAAISERDDLMKLYHEAQFVVSVRAENIFPNCPRYIHRMELVERSHFVPQVKKKTPVPEWKQSEWARDVLPDNDPARRRK